MAQLGRRRGAGGTGWAGRRLGPDFV